MARGYSEPVGNDYGADDNNRDRWRDNERERSNWRDRDDNRGFFEKAGEEVRSWFSDDDRPDRNFEDSRSSWNRDRELSRSGAPQRSSWDRDRSSGSQRSPSIGREDRSNFGGMAQGGYGRSSSSQSRERERFGQSSKDFGGFRNESDFRGQRRSHPQSWGEANRGQSDWDRELADKHLGYGDFSGTLGGFGNQTFGSSQDDHYRSWRDRQMAQLDRDYDDYCREREQQFHSDFDSWRRSRPAQSQFGSGSNADLDTSSNAGVGTTTASMTGTAGSGSAIGSATGTGGSIQADTTGSTEAADAGSRTTSRK